MSRAEVDGTAGLYMAVEPGSDGSKTITIALSKPIPGQMPAWFNGQRDGEAVSEREWETEDGGTYTERYTHRTGVVSEHWTSPRHSPVLMMTVKV